MPNWCENELTITGPDVQTVLTAIRSESHNDNDAHILDFNRIIPYPKIYKELDERAEEYRKKLQAIHKDDPERHEKLEALAAEYGVEAGTPWLKEGFNSGGYGYEWTCDSWGTKWNATGVALTTRKDTNREQNNMKVKCSYCQTIHNTNHITVLNCQQCGSPLPDSYPIMAYLEFDTAWSPPVPVIEKLASMFPDHEFDLKYFEGGIGFCGHARWEQGEEQSHHLDDYNGPRGG